VIGGGAAATRAAIEASDCGSDVLMVTKMKYGYCGSSFYVDSIPWGINTAGSSEDDKRAFLDEIIHASCGCLNKKLAEILVRDSDERFKELYSYGIKFHMNVDKPCFGRKLRGASLISLDNARSCFKEQLNKRNIRIIDNVQVHDLIVKENVCRGAVGIDSCGEVMIFGSKTVILATGGAEYLWKYSFALPDMTGDGYAMAARHGARLTNLEFIQFIPGIVSPVSRTNFHHPTFKTLPEVYNSRNEKFLAKYLPDGVTVEQCLEARAGHGPFSNEDSSKYFDIAMCMEGRNNNGGKCKGVQIKYTDTYYNDSKNETWKDFLLSRGIDTKKTTLEIYPHCQGFNGGILIDEQCSTDIENLYACGECAGGPHGANRIGGNAVLGTQVFGKIAGEEAAKKAKNIKRANISDYSFESIIGINFDTGNLSQISSVEIMDNIRKIMQESAFIIREETGLKEGITKIEKLQGEYNPYQCIKDGEDIGRVLNLHNSLLTSRIILYSMFNRRESRGGHYRKDYSGKGHKKYESMAYIRLDSKNNVLIEQDLVK